MEISNAAAIGLDALREELGLPDYYPPEVILGSALGKIRGLKLENEIWRRTSA